LPVKQAIDLSPQDEKFLSVQSRKFRFAEARRSDKRIWGCRPRGGTRTEVPACGAEATHHAGAGGTPASTTGWKGAGRSCTWLPWSTDATSRVMAS